MSLDRSMTLDQLRVFVCVAEHEHMTRAAERLNTTQSSVSASIASIEKQYGVDLFHRTGRRIELTTAGTAFVVEAHRILDAVASAERLLDEHSKLHRGVLTIAASQTIASYWLPPRIARFRQDFRGIDVQVKANNTKGVAQAVSEGVFELGFVEGMVSQNALQQRAVGRDNLIIVAPVGHPWARRQSIAPHELVRAKWVLRERGSGTRSEFEAYLRAADVAADTLDVVIELPTNESVLSAVEAGAGIAVVSQLAARSGLESKRYEQLPCQLPSRRFSMLRRGDRALGPPAHAFVEMINSGETYMKGET